MFDHDHPAGPRRHHRDPRRWPHHDLRHGPEDVPFALREMLRRSRAGGRSIRRGEIRPLILAALARRPMHGYEVIQELEAQSGGRWRPSAGSVYPTLQQLADEGLVTSEEVEGRRTYTLTETGQAAAEETPAVPAWGDLDREGDPDLRRLGLQLVQAVIQVQQVGSAKARRETTRILAEARREVYRLLAEDDATEPGEGQDAPA